MTFSVMTTMRLEDAVKVEGFANVPSLLSEEFVDQLKTLTVTNSGSMLRRKGETYAARNLFAVPLIRELASAPKVTRLVKSVLGDEVFAVRALMFDKVPGANWRLGWHQDVVISVAARRDVPGFTAWTMKKGIPHVRPPVELLENMIAVRIHLDDCDRENGALCVIPATHRDGILSECQVKKFVDEVQSVVLEASRGSAVFMHPLLLHSSAPATSPRHRRVIHIEYAAHSLPGGLEWANKC